MVLAVFFEALVAHDNTGWMIRWCFEFGCDNALVLPAAHQCAVGASPGRQSERAQNYGLPRAGFTGQRTKTLTKLKVKPVYK
jgi:hypothetical protein